MFANYVLRAQLTAKSIARKSVFGTLGGLFALVGIGFLGAAGWLWLADAYGALNANLIIGGIFILIGIVVIGYSRIPPRIIPREQSAAMADPTRASAPPMSGNRTMTAASVAEAFLLGLAAARALRRRD
ncbi:hypothetical protein ILP92_02535 [Maribius pontilimi]|uniref:Holin-X, holin superfamily III n=1 Tax=Palleronia pontilimi TaxID=1964209 RepID=A0A934M8P2_9RHOB|nr:hypothetical protein [Palleronia pontilimi]MBJ3761627.1 hypothetical protein [Palleronia pontilimi]